MKLDCLGNLNREQGQVLMDYYSYEVTLKTFLHGGGKSHLSDLLLSKMLNKKFGFQWGSTHKQIPYQ